MEERILEAEQGLEDCRAAMQAPEVVSDPIALQNRLYARWAELEAKLP